MNKESCDLRSLMHTELSLLSYAGYYAPQRTVISLIKFSVNSLAIVLILGTMVTKLVLTEDLSKATQTLVLCTTLIVLFFKLLNFLLRKNDFNEILRVLASESFNCFNGNDLKTIRNVTFESNFFGNSYRIACVICVLSMALCPLLSEEMELPYPAWTPWKIEKKLDLLYFCTFFLQVFCLFVSAATNCTLDALNGKMINLAASLIEVLKINLQEIDFREGINARNELVSWIKYQKSLNHLIELINRTFSTGIFFQFSCSGLVICFTCFQVILNGGFNSVFIMLIVYLIVVLVQLSMYCYFGHDVMSKSLEISTALYKSNWYEADLSTKKTIIIFMEYSKRPVVLTAGKFFSLSLITLMTIIRSSYSYLAVLQRVYN